MYFHLNVIYLRKANMFHTYAASLCSIQFVMWNVVFSVKVSYQSKLVYGLCTQEICHHPFQFTLRTCLTLNWTNSVHDYYLDGC